MSETSRSRTSWWLSAPNVSSGAVVIRSRGRLAEAVWLVVQDGCVSYQSPPGGEVALGPPLGHLPHRAYVAVTQLGQDRFAGANPVSRRA